MFENEIDFGKEIENCFKLGELESKKEHLSEAIDKFEETIEMEKKYLQEKKIDKHKWY
jgi:hypothetical protein